MGSRRRRTDSLPHYVYDIPYGVRRNVCKILDVEDDWKSLAAKLDIHSDDIKEYEREHQRPGGSPADRLLTRMGHRCCTVQQLFFQLSSLQLKRACDAMKGVVPGGCIQEAERLKEKEYSSIVSCAMPCETDELDDFPPMGYNESRRHPVESDHNEKPGPSENCESNQTKLDDQASYGSSVNYQHKDSNVQKPWHAASKQVPHTGQESLMASGMRRRNITVGSSENNQSTGSEGTQEEMYLTFGHNNAAFPPPRHFSHDELKPMFNDGNIIGNGGFGQVFKGQLQMGMIAVKQLKKIEGASGKEDIDKKSQASEIKALMKYRHENIISLLGYSEDGPELCLVYEFMSNGSLEDRLRRKNDTSPLPWRQRHVILKDSACGIHYLHTAYEKPLIHGDLKSANILLDNNMVAKIADFGLAVEATSGTGTKCTYYSTSNEFFFGSHGYLPDELYTSGLRYNIKTDVYSLGIIIYETCTALKALDKSRGRDNEKLKEHMENVKERGQVALLQMRDSSTPDWPDQTWLNLISIGDLCSQEKKNKRPEISLVLEELEILWQRIQIPTTPGGLYANNSLLCSNLAGSERSYHLAHISGGPGRSLQACPSPQCQDSGGDSYPQPPPHSPGAISEESMSGINNEYEANQECDQKKIAEIKAFDNQTSLKEHQFVHDRVQAYTGNTDLLKPNENHERSIDSNIGHRPSTEGPDVPKWPAYDPKKIAMQQQYGKPSHQNSYYQSPSMENTPSEEPEAFALQRHYDAQNQLNKATVGDSTSCRVFKVDRRTHQGHTQLSIEADEDSSDDDQGPVLYENTAIPPELTAPLPSGHQGQGRVYTNEQGPWDEDHAVELIRKQMQSHVPFKTPCPGEDGTEVQSMPPMGHKTKTLPYGSMPVHMNPYRHNTECLQNVNNDNKELETPKQAKNDLSARGQESTTIPKQGGHSPKQQTGGRDSPKEVSDPEEDEESGPLCNSITRDIMQHKSSKQFPSALPVWDTEASLGESEDHGSMLSSDSFLMEDYQGPSYRLVRNVDSGLYETDPGFSSPLSEHCGNGYIDMGLSVERGRSQELSSSPSTPTHSSVLNNPSSPPIYANAGRYQTEST